MKQFLSSLAIVCAVLFAACNNTKVGAEPTTSLHLIEVPEGFTVELFADNVPNARSMEWSPEGILFVGTRQDDKVYALPDRDRDNVADTVIIIDEGLTMPNGVALKDGDLYVAEVSRILRYKDIVENLTTAESEVVFEQLPDDRSHGWKFIKFSPEGDLFVPVGAPCNVCRREDKRYASILRVNLNDRSYEVFAEGIRNTVGFDWHPETGELWFTDNGRDWMGDNRPPDELNRAPEPGLHFGFPFCHGGDVPDPEFGKPGVCDEYVPPVLELGPHVAALGMRFYTGEMFPSEYRNQIFIAEHGSWNRTNKIGYRVMLVRLNGSEVVSKEPFATGWLQGEDAWGRPVDVQVMPDGALLVSDDRAGAIYRIFYGK
jgi:glucose/arabinose dehydrogenase